MISFTEYAKKYAASHENLTAYHLHMLGIPLIFLSLMIFLGFVRISVPGILHVSLTDLVMAVLLIYYARLNWRLTLILIPIAIFLLFVTNLFSHNGPSLFGFWSFVCLFLMGCGLQFTGYYLEGKRPDFQDMLCQLFIAPLCMAADFFFKLGRMLALQEIIYGTRPKDKI